MAFGAIEIRDMWGSGVCVLRCLGVSRLDVEAQTRVAV